MKNDTTRPETDHRQAAELLAELIVEHEDIIWGIGGLRELGDAGGPALDAVLAIPAVRQLILSWQLVEALATGDGVDLDLELIDLLGYEYLDHVEGVLFPLGGEVPPLAIVR